MPDSVQQLRDRWATQWEKALALWSKFTKLSEPRWCLTEEEAAREGLTDSFAMIRLTDQAVVVSLPLIQEHRLEDFALEILAHEIGHHIYCPADLLDQGRMMARMRRALPTKEHLAGFIANLYADLLINDRLQRSEVLRMAKVYETIGGGSTDRMWTLYMRIYEMLWSLRKGTLAKGAIDDQLECDAYLGRRVIRSYAKDWLGGAGRFAALCLPYLLTDEGKTIQQILACSRDLQKVGVGDAAVPPGLTEIEADEEAGALHPANDPELSGLDARPEKGKDVSDQPLRRPQQGERGCPGGQYREPLEFGALLKSLGMDLSDHESAVRYYKERAVPHLIRFPPRVVPESTEPMPEGLELWDVGSPLEDADWAESVMTSPHVVPGFTTVQRVWGTTEGALPEKEPLDLDLYVDSSGSMPNPQREGSYLALAGAIVALSALRAGARVQATLWSGAREFETTAGFIRDELRILQVLTGYIGGSTAFPIHILRDTYQDRRPGDRPVHILIISDEGVTTMFDRDEKGNCGWEVARTALGKARGGGTMALNLPQIWQQNEGVPKATHVPTAVQALNWDPKCLQELSRAHKEGWQIHPVRTWEDLLAFARWFSDLKYAEKPS
jgi:hypothetical protein